MKNKTYNVEEITVEFNDNNIKHVLAGPNYGQPWGDWDGWEETECEFEEIDSVVV